MEKIAASGIRCVVLREKDLSSNEYDELAISVSALCQKHNVRFIAHTFCETALKLDVPVHLPCDVFKNFSQEHEKNRDIQSDISQRTFGVSVHSPEQASAAEKAGASWLIGGHVFETKSKEGLEGRGPGFLSAVCKVSKVPVYAIGGINRKNIGLIAKSGIAGVCLMSSLMQSPDPQMLVEELLAVAASC